LRRDLLDVGQPADGDLLAVGRGLEIRRRRRQAGGDAGELAPAPAKRAAAMGIAAPAGGRRCGRARAGPGHARGCGGDCGAGRRANGHR